VTRSVYVVMRMASKSGIVSSGVRLHKKCGLNMNFGRDCTSKLRTRQLVFHLLESMDNKSISHVVMLLWTI
jgi:hypothetical protein